MTTNYKYVIRRANGNFEFPSDISNLNINFLNPDFSGKVDVLYAYDPLVKNDNEEIQEDLRKGSSVIFDKVVKAKIEKKYNEGRAPKLATSIAVAKVVATPSPVAIVVAKPASAATKPAIVVAKPLLIPAAIVVTTTLLPIKIEVKDIGISVVNSFRMERINSLDLPKLVKTKITPRDTLDEKGQELETTYLQDKSSLYITASNGTIYYGLPNIKPKTFCYFNSIMQLFKEILVEMKEKQHMDQAIKLFLEKFAKEKIIPEEMLHMRLLHFNALKFFHKSWNPPETLKMLGTKESFQKTYGGREILNKYENGEFNPTTETIFARQSPAYVYLFIKSLLQNQDLILELPFGMTSNVQDFLEKEINLTTLLQSHYIPENNATYIFVSNFDGEITNVTYNITVKGKNYDLVGIIYMKSQINAGRFDKSTGENHFMAITKQSDGKWYVFDDQNVAEIKLTNDNILESSMPTFVVVNLAYSQTANLKINDPTSKNGGIFALLYKKQPLPYVLVFSDFDGTLTRYNGDTLLKSDFYVNLYGFQSGKINRETQLQNKYDSQIKLNPTYAITDAAAELIKEVLTIPNGKFIIVTRNREDYVKLALQHKFKDNSEMLKKIEIRAVNHEFGAKNTAVTNYLASFTNQISCIYVFDGSTKDFAQMRSPAVNKISPDKVYGENKQPEEYEAYFKLITPQIKNCTAVFP